MKKLIAATAFTLMCGLAFAQTTGAPAAAQNDTNKPGMNNPDRGSMNQGTTGTSSMPSPGGDASLQKLVDKVGNSAAAIRKELAV